MSINKKDFRGVFTDEGGLGTTSSFRNTPYISSSYKANRRSPSSYTFMSYEENRNNRKNNGNRRRTKITDTTEKISSVHGKDKSFWDEDHLKHVPNPNSIVPKSTINDDYTINTPKKLKKVVKKKNKGGKRRTKKRSSIKHKNSINCRNPKGFTRKQYCKYGSKSHHGTE